MATGIEPEGAEATEATGGTAGVGRCRAGCRLDRYGEKLCPSLELSPTLHCKNTKPYRDILTLLNVQKP